MADNDKKEFFSVVGSLGKVMGDLVAIGYQVTKAIDTTQKSALQLGVSVESTFEKFNTSFENTLQGGFITRLESVLDILNTGLETNSTGLLELVNSQRLTNQDSKKTAKAFANLTAALGLNDEELTEMSESLIETSKEYRVSTSRLVDTFDSLERTLGTKALLDMGPQLNMAVTKLVGEMPEAQRQINSFANLMMDKSQKGLDQRIALGISQDAVRLRAAETEEEARQILLEAITKVKDFGSQFDFNKDDLVTLGAITQAFGQGVEDAVIIFKNLGKREKTAEDQQADFNDALSTQIGNAFYAIQRELFTRLAEPMRDSLKTIGTFMKENGDVIKGIGNAIQATIEGLLELLGRMDFNAITSKITEIFSRESFSLLDLGELFSVFSLPDNDTSDSPNGGDSSPIDKREVERPMFPDFTSLLPMVLNFSAQMNDLVTNSEEANEHLMNLVTLTEQPKGSPRAEMITETTG